VTEKEEEVNNYSLSDLSSNDISRERAESRRESKLSLFEQELAAITRMVSGGRHASACQPDEFECFLDQMRFEGYEGNDLAARVESFENAMQYDESGAILMMSSHERTLACGHLDWELTAEELPSEAQYLATELRRDYVSGKSIEEMWEEIYAQIEVLFPISGKTATGGRFYSYAHRELQVFCRNVLEAIMTECQSDFHLTALRTNKVYRGFHKAVRSARDTKALSETMKSAYQARQSGTLSLKHFIGLNTASKLQRERLERARLSKNAHLLLKEVKRANNAKLRYLAWAMYGTNQPDHPVHKLPEQEKSIVWQELKSRRASTQVATV
jgi:hypothetical protein